jgi:CHAT domain-containing protein/tetratricopeptide (TPR) repeat protein
LAGVAAAVIGLAACSGDAPPEKVLFTDRIEIAAGEAREVSFTAAANAPIRVTVSGQGIDVKVKLESGNVVATDVDAPNRRLGVETLFMPAAHRRTVALRIASNDHSGARGHAQILAVALPEVSAADRRRIEAARLDAEGCRLYSDLASGKASAEAFAAAAALHASAGSTLREGLANLQAAGAQYVRLANWHESARLAAEAFSRLESAGAGEFAAYSLRLEGAALDQAAQANAGTAAARDSQSQRARDRFTEAFRRFEVLGNSYEAGYALNYRGVSFDAAGKREAARADFLNALRYFRKANDRPAQALSLQSLALLSYQDGRLPDAIREFDQALALIPRDEDPEDYAHTLHNSALPLRTIGRFDEAIDRFDQAGRILHEQRDRDGEARALHGLGTTLMHAGEPERAIELLQAAIDLRGQSGSRREQAASLMALGESERQIGRVTEAIAHQEATLGLVTAPHDIAQARLFLARAHVAGARQPLARHALEEILRLPLSATHLYRGLALAELGTLDSMAGNSASAETYFARALNVLMTIGSDLEQARTLVARAATRSRARELDAAIADCDAATALFEAIGFQALQADSRMAFRASYRQASEIKIAALIAKSRDPESDSDSSAVQDLLHRALLVSDRNRAQILAERGDSAVPGARSATGKGPAQVYELLAGKRALRDRLQASTEPDYARIAELTRDIARLRSEAPVLPTDGRKGLDVGRYDPSSDFRAGRGLAVPPNAVVAEYFVGAESTWVFEVRGNQIAVRSLGSAADFEKLARELHDSWKARAQGTPERQVLSQALANRLFRGMASPEAGATLYLIPDGPLHIVPMAVLARQAMPRAPMGAFRTATSLRSVLVDGEMNVSRPDRLVAVIADPIYSIDDPRIRGADPESAVTRDDPLRTRHAEKLAGLRRLPSTAVEANAIMNLTGRAGASIALIGSDATRTGVQSAGLAQYRIVHFATHAFSDSEDPALSTLALSRFDGNGNALVGDLQAFDVASLGLNAELVVLSACDTAVGREIRGEAPLGLARAFLQGGARSVLATLWQVPDTATARLMEEFYRQILSEQRAPAEALELAQLHVRNQPRWSDPYYWAGFQLVSNAPMYRGNNNVN